MIGGFEVSLPFRLSIGCFYMALGIFSFWFERDTVNVFRVINTFYIYMGLQCLQVILHDCFIKFASIFQSRCYKTRGHHELPPSKPQPFRQSPDESLLWLRMPIAGLHPWPRTLTGCFFQGPKVLFVPVQEDRGFLRAGAVD